MAKHKQPSSIDRLAVVAACLEMGRDFKGCAQRFGLTYHQVYHWVRRYERLGARGFENTTDTTPQSHQNRALRAEKRRLEVENAILCKLKELERTWG